MTATVAPIDAYDADAATLKAQQPNATASRRSKAGITDTSVWQLLCTILIVCYSLWGWYLFTFGVSDFRRGSADIQDTCPIAAQLQALDRIVPMGVLLRCCLSTKILRIIGRAKAVARNRNWRKRACCNPWTALYLGCWALPWFWLLGLVSTPGLGPPAINVAGNWTIENWPVGCEVEAPFHGLLQTRLWACFTGILLESVVVIFAVRSIDSPTAFGKAGAYTMAVPCILGLIFGPADFLVRATEVCPDIARAIAYLVVVALATVIKLVLRLHKRLVPAAVKSAKRPLENKWVIAWFVVTGIEIVVLEVLVETGVELKGGSPWLACGAPWKEFYFPRFKGLIFWEYVSLVSFGFWVHGVWWRQQHDASFVSTRDLLSSTTS